MIGEMKQGLLEEAATKLSAQPLSNVAMGWRAFAAMNPGKARECVIAWGYEPRAVVIEDGAIRPLEEEEI